MENRSDIAKSYNPEEVETKWAREWLDGIFQADENSTRQPFSIVIPPPNVTGSLHLGHALNNTLQDILCRYMRQRGREVLWMPGTDHAGIATQNVVERQLLQEGLSRQALGRDKFVERVWDWKEHSGGRIISQLKRLGCSCDWSRERFTMDEGLSRAVRHVFVTLYKQGLIYRGSYMIHWCPRCASALSDLEVEYPEDFEEGALYRLRYPLAGDAGHSQCALQAIEVDTTRPETMLGDTAVAVHPADERYRAYIGKQLVLPIVGREIPIIADEMVDLSFGSGAVKITPGHDMADYQVGLRHGLPIVTVMDEAGRMNELAGKYAGLDRFACREALVKDLREAGVLIEVRKHPLKTGRCYRCHSVVEPRVSLQWFMRMRELADAAASALRDGRTRIVPENWSHTYYQWLDNIRDWCVSRQLWWGHQIPVWYCDCGAEICDEADPAHCPSCGGAGLRRDPDVLDTWFSSALWPFTTMGWPEETATLAKFYPTSVMITGFDILFFWVARMMMMGLKLTGEVPFKDIFLHAMVRDEHGHKMSKTKGNVVDPLDLIKDYGADALRFTLAIMTVQGRDVNLSTARIAGYRNFVNKIWNAVRFVQLTLNDCGVDATAGLTLQSAEDLPQDLASRWIRSRLAAAIENTEAAYGEYQFSELCNTLYRFFWDEFCSWYIESAKLSVREASSREEQLKYCRNLLLCTDISLRLLNPVIPFVTEELWSGLPPLNGIKHNARKAGLVRAAFPTLTDYHAVLRKDADAEMQMSLVEEVIVAVRTIRSEKSVPPGKLVPLNVSGPAQSVSLIRASEHLIRGLARVSAVGFGAAEAAGGAASIKAVCGLTVSVPLDDLIDITAELERISKDMRLAELEIARAKAKLESEDFRKRAPQAVVLKEEAKLREHQEKLDVLRAASSELKAG